MAAISRENALVKACGLQISPDHDGNTRSFASFPIPSFSRHSACALRWVRSSSTRRSGRATVRRLREDVEQALALSETTLTNSGAAAAFRPRLGPTGKSVRRLWARKSGASTVCGAGARRAEVGDGDPARRDAPSLLPLGGSPGPSDGPSVLQPGISVTYSARIKRPLECHRYAPSSRLAIRAPRRSRCDTVFTNQSTREPDSPGARRTPLAGSLRSPPRWRGRAQRR